MITTNAHFELDAKLNETKVEKLLKEYGWRHGERHDGDGWLNRPFEINHKYVEISYRGI